MIATTHVIIGGAVGVAVGTVTKNPAAALVAGIISHLLCDLVPHTDTFVKFEYRDGIYDQPIWTKKLYAAEIANSLLAFFLTLFIWQRYFHFEFFAPYAWAALGAYLPDLIDNVPFWNLQIRQLPGFKQFHALHLAIHDVWRFRFPMPKYQLLGWLTQIIAVSISFWVLFR